MIRFNPGDLVVHPVYGLCRIAAVEHAHVRDALEECYVFRVGSVSDPVKILIPVVDAEAAGLRHPVSRSEAAAVLQVFQLPATPFAPHTREELQDTALRLNSRDLHLVATTIRDLVAAGVKGWLGQPEGAFANSRRSEHAMLARALERLIEELAYVQHTSPKSIEGSIRACLGRTRRKRAPQVLIRG